MPYAYVVSDGTGRTADLVLKSALAQFEGANLEIIIHRDIREPKQIVKIVREASERNAFIVHTLVSHELRQVIWEASGFASGIYLYRLKAGSYTQTKKLILLR